jgi:Fe-Mn family superoxide dismutase
MEEVGTFLKDGKVDQEEMPAYSELKRRLGFEFNGMVLHEYYFENLMPHGGGDPPSDSLLYKRAEEFFGDYSLWKQDFMGVGKMRGVGWAICFQDPSNGRLSNHWISLHEMGNVAGFQPILVMDVWEHAYLLDYKPSERQKYIEAFFSNVDWEKVDERLKNSFLHEKSKKEESYVSTKRGNIPMSGSRLRMRGPSHPRAKAEKRG